MHPKEIIAGKTNKISSRHMEIKIPCLSYGVGHFINRVTVWVISIPYRIIF